MRETIFAIGFFSAFACGVWLGYVIGWSRGFNQWRMKLEDSVMTGLGISKGGKRVDPKDFYTTGGVEPITRKP